MRKVRDILSGLDLVGNIDIDSIQVLAASVHEASQVKYKPVGVPFGTFFDDGVPGLLGSTNNEGGLLSQRRRTTCIGAMHTAEHSHIYAQRAGEELDVHPIIRC